MKCYKVCFSTDPYKGTPIAIVAWAEKAPDLKTALYTVKHFHDKDTMQHAVDIWIGAGNG